MVETRKPSQVESRDIPSSNGRLHVVGSQPVTPRMLRLTTVVRTPHLPIDTTCPNLVLRLVPPTEVDTAGPSGARPPSRTYTIRRYDDASGHLDIDVVLHGDGPFVHWATSAAAGDTIEFTGPRPHAVPSFEADALVMLSDETGLPALAALLDAAPRGLRVHAFIEVADAAEEQPLSTGTERDRNLRPNDRRAVGPPPRVHVTWLHRDGAAAGTTGALERATRSLEWPGGRVEVWAAGETSEVRAVRRFVASERDVARADIHAYGYWRRGRSGSPS